MTSRRQRVNPAQRPGSMKNRIRRALEDFVALEGACCTETAETKLFERASRGADGADVRSKYRLPSWLDAVEAPVGFPDPYRTLDFSDVLPHLFQIAERLCDDLFISERTLLDRSENRHWRTELREESATYAIGLAGADTMGMESAYPRYLRGMSSRVLRQLEAVLSAPISIFDAPRSELVLHSAMDEPLVQFQATVPHTVLFHHALEFDADFLARDAAGDELLDELLRWCIGLSADATDVDDFIRHSYVALHGITFSSQNTLFHVLLHERDEGNVQIIPIEVDAYESGVARPLARLLQYIGTESPDLAVPMHTLFSQYAWSTLQCYGNEFAHGPDLVSLPAVERDGYDVRRPGVDAPIDRTIGLGPLELGMRWN